MDAKRNSSWLIENGRIIDPSQNVDRVGRLLLIDGHVAALDPLNDDVPANCTRVDAGGCIVAPGLVDIATELGEPGLEENETIETGTMAALAGGYTSLACSASTDPPIDTASDVEFVRQKAAKADRARVYVIGCVSKGRAGEELAEIGSLVDAGAIALSDSPLPMGNTALLRKALEYCLMFNRPIIDRPEVRSLNRDGVMHEGLTQLVLGLAPMPAEAEDLATARDLRLLESTGGRLHLNGISTAGSIEIIRRAKDRGAIVTVDTRIMNLCFDEECLRTFDANYKVNPPLRSRRDVDLCIEAVSNGTIDMITSGHQPKSLEKKMQELDAVPFGVTSLDTCLSQAITYLISKGKLEWSRAIDCFSTQPARMLGIDAGTLSVGSPADVVVIDPELRWTVESSQLFSRNRNTPLLGHTLQGRARMVWVGGQLKYELAAK